MLTFSEMVALIDEITPLLKGSTVLRIQEMGTKKWTLTFLHGEKEYTLLISAQVPFSRFHLARRSHQKRETRFTHALEEKLIGSFVQKIELLNGDRILAISCEKKGEKWIWITELCFKHPHVVLVTPSYQIIESWEPIQEESYQLPQKMRKQPMERVVVDSATIEENYQAREDAARLEHKKRWAIAQLEKKVRKGEERHHKHLSEKEESRQWEEKMHVGQLLQSHFHVLRRGARSITVEDWERNGQKREIPLDPLIEPQEQIKKVFKEARKLKKRGELIDSLISQVVDEINRLKNLQTRLAQATSESDLDQIISLAGLLKQKQPSRNKEEKHREPFREFITEAGLSIYVGRSDLDNDRLSFSFARGSDHWFHAANVPGSHVVLKVPRSGLVDQGSLQDALQLALYFSKARDRGEDDVVMTECKFLSKSKGGKPGQVNLSRHKTVHVRLDQVRIQRLLKKLL
jgi:predicted ribosome quality control (RQC) complex YloA/Tae2 family protein